MQKTPFRSLAATILLVHLSLASADPVRWSGNGHFYEVMSAPGTISWEDANTAAVAAGGYLATITSSDENAFVFGIVNNAAYWHDASGPWLGGYQSPATPQPNANWRWVTGEPWSYTNWQNGQPNDSGGKAEDKLQFGFAPLVSVWNDIMSVEPTPAYRPIAYVVEWDYDPLAPTLEAWFSQTSLQIELCWQTAPNRFYQLLYSSVLTTNQWAPLSSNWVSGDGSRHCETDVILPSSPAKFYRLTCTNAPPR
jgi:Lectin C-type domain